MSKQSNIKTILLGFSEFEDETIQNIPNVNVNISYLEKVLKTKLEIPERNIHSFINLTSSEDVLNKVGRIIDELQKNDVLFFYYTGHGFISDKSGFELFWSHTKSFRNSIHRNGIKATNIISEIKDAKSKNKIVILDCCHAGKSLVGIQSTPVDAINGTLEQSFKSTEGLFAISAVDEFDVATFTVDNPNEPTHFTAAFIDSLTQNFNKTLEQIYNTTYNLLESRNQKLPQKIAKNSIGDFTFFQPSHEQPVNIFQTNVREVENDYLPIPKPKEMFSVSPARRNQADFYLNSALAMRNKKRYDECFVFLEKAIEQNPFDPEIHLSFGITKGFVMANDLHGAIEHFEKVIELSPNHPKALSNMGILQYNLGKYLEAEKTLELATQVEPLNPGIWSNLGLTKTILNREDAEKCLRKAITLNPKFTAALNNIGNLYKEKKQFKRATFYYKKVIYLEPNNYDAWNNLGLTYLEWSEFGSLPNGKKNENEVNSENVVEFALLTLVKAIEIDKYDYRAYTNIIKAFLEINDDKGSDIAMNVAHRLDEIQQKQYVSFPQSEYLPINLINYIKHNYTLFKFKPSVEYIQKSKLRWDDSTVYGGENSDDVYKILELTYKGEYILGDEEIIFYHPGSIFGNKVYQPSSNGHIVFYATNSENSLLEDIVLIKIDGISLNTAQTLVKEIDNILSDDNNKSYFLGSEKDSKEALYKYRKKRIDDLIKQRINMFDILNVLF